jgi:ligand-binding SRPBCC domain-containing protein
LAPASAEAVWEWVATPQPTQKQTLQFGVVLAMAQSGALPAAQTATVHLSLGPLSQVASASQSDPVPRFADFSQALNLFTVL